MFIEQPSIWLRWLYPRASWRMDHNDHSVYLTFDDGPIPESTPFILQTLKEFGIHATFFMVGDNVRKYPELYKQIVADGHQVGNHTYHHLGGFKHLTSTYVKDTNRANELIGSHLFRPPHGCMSGECEALRPQRFNHHVPRLAKEYREAAYCFAAFAAMAKGARL